MSDLPKAIIVDLDGTLANVDHRMHHVRGEGRKNWKRTWPGRVTKPPSVKSSAS